MAKKNKNSTSNTYIQRLTALSRWVVWLITTGIPAYSIYALSLGVLFWLIYAQTFVQAFRISVAVLAATATKYVFFLLQLLASHRRQISKTVTYAGLTVAIISAAYLWNRQSILAFKAEPAVITPIEETRKAAPSTINLGAGSEAIVIQPARITDGVWETQEAAANHLVTSANPGENGNVVVYAHNKPDLFRPLHSLELGQEITVTSTDGETYTYQVSDIITVDPDAVEVVYPTDREMLTLYTCSGWFDQQRLVVRAVPTDSLTLNE